jgi:hypothetical protein
MKLKEDPREWKKFTAVLAAVIALASYGLWRRKALPDWGVDCGLALAALLMTGALIRPRIFRMPYRLAMAGSHRIGQGTGRVLLTLFFLLLLTPLGWLLRLMGKDLLGLRRRKDAATYWVTSRPASPLDRMF